MRRIPLIVLASASPILLLALLIGGETGSWVLAVVSPLFPVALMALADGPPQQRGRQVVWLAAWLMSLEIGTVGMLLLDGRPEPVAGGLGLPPSTVMMLVALGLIPLVLVPLGHAVLFPRRPDAPGSDPPYEKSLDR